MQIQGTSNFSQNKHQIQEMNYLRPRNANAKKAQRKLETNIKDDNSQPLA